MAKDIKYRDLIGKIFFMNSFIYLFFMLPGFIFQAYEFLLIGIGLALQNIIMFVYVIYEEAKNERLDEIDFVCDRCGRKVHIKFWQKIYEHRYMGYIDTSKTLNLCKECINERKTISKMKNTGVLEEDKIKWDECHKDIFKK